jgi:ribosomal-protein-alanine N-acetyltransferase
MTVIRPIRAATDAGPLADYYVTNWPHLSPWEPERAAAFLTSAGQWERATALEAQIAAGTGYACVIEQDGEIAGQIALNEIVRGPAQCANLGYSLAARFTGRGIATRAVELMMTEAFGRLGLHRVQASTLLANVASQKVLARCGFSQIGLAPSYLRIGGRWQDSLLFQRLTTVEA